jgi:hypothetical protein
MELEVSGRGEIRFYDPDEMREWRRTKKCRALVNEVSYYDFGRHECLKLIQSV